MIGVQVLEWTLHRADGACDLCGMETTLAKIQRQDDHIWVWAEACQKCKTILRITPCPDAVEGDGSVVSVAAWLAHLRSHGWRESDFDLNWLKRAKRYTAERETQHD